MPVQVGSGSVAGDALSVDQLLPVLTNLAAGVAFTNPVDRVSSKRVRLTLTNFTVPLADNAGVVAFGGVSLGKFPEGAIRLDGALVNLTITKSSAGVNADWDGDIGLGSAQANNGNALAGTEQDILPTTPTPQAVAGVASVKAFSTANEIGKTLDGTGGAKDIWLNVLVDDTDHDVTGTPCNLIFNGTIDISYGLLGDY